MANTIFQQAPQNPLAGVNLQQIQSIMRTLNPNQSPQQMLQNLVAQNPQYSSILNLVNQNNGDIRSVVMNLARERGVDLNALYQGFMQQK